MASAWRARRVSWSALLGGAQGGRRLRPASTRPIRRNGRPHAGRLAGPGGRDLRPRCCRASPRARGRFSLDPESGEPCGAAAERGGARCRRGPEQPRLRHLHLGLDRPAQGRSPSSTGAPSRLVRWRGRPSPRRSSARRAVRTSVSFDLSVFRAVRPAAGSGGAVVIVRGERPRASPSLRAAAEKSPWSTLVPSAMAELVRAGRPAAGVRTVIWRASRSTTAWRAVRADRGRSSAPQPLRADRGHDRDSTVARAEPGRAARRRSAGRCPARASTCSTQDLRRCRPAWPGELCIGGAGLARGYLGRPELTAERFVPHRSARAGRAALPDGRPGALPARRRRSSSSAASTTRSRSGASGSSSGEIEAVLAAAPGVREAVVLAREDAPGTRLVAYLVGSEGTRGGAAARGPGRAAARLHGAVGVRGAGGAAADAERQGRPPRAAGAGAGGCGRGFEAGYVAPRTPAEEVVAAIWAEVLGVARVGVEDNFFELGGHSLLAVRVIARLRDASGSSCRCASCSRRRRWLS